MATELVAVGTGCWEDRAWRTTREIATSVGLAPLRARKRLEQLRLAGVMQRTVGDDGEKLWRLAPEAAQPWRRTGWE